MANTVYRRGVGIFARVDLLRQALDELQASGFPMDRVSAIAREQTTPATPSRVVPNKAQSGATTGAITGGTVGGVMGLLAGLGTIAAVPGLGPIVLIGAAATALASTLTSGVMGATVGGLFGAFIGYGIPEDRAKVYQQRVQQGGYLVIIDGSQADLRRVEPLLHRWQVEDWHIVDLPTASPMSASPLNADRRL